MLVAELCPASQMSTLVIFIGDWSPHMKLLRNFGYIKMYTGLWSRDRTNISIFPILFHQELTTDMHSSCGCSSITSVYQYFYETCVRKTLFPQKDKKVQRPAFIGTEHVWSRVTVSNLFRWHFLHTKKKVE